MNQSQIEGKLSRNYAKAGGKNAKTIPWDKVIEIFMKIFQGCTTPQVQAFCEEHPAAAAFVGRGALRDNYAFSGYSAAELTKIAKAGVVTIGQMSEKEVDYLRP